MRVAICFVLAAIFGLVLTGKWASLSRMQCECEAVEGDRKMEAISCPVLDFRQVAPNDFVQYWAQFVPNSKPGFDEDFYRQNIGKPLTEERIAAWFKWKNRTPLSAAKKQTVHRSFSREERVDNEANVRELEEFLKRPGGAIWRIFWLHLLDQRFPIYDQHVHRAMAFILKWPKNNREIPVHNAGRIRTYLKHYRPFFGRFLGCHHRQTDQALWCFGRFLKSRYGSSLEAFRTS